MIIWDLNRDIEKYSFDIQKNAILFQDFNGSPYIAEKDYIINCEQGCKLKSYKFSIKDFSMVNCSFKCNYGHRMEVQSHNFVIFRNVINLSFSYMTFVIKDRCD